MLLGVATFREFLDGFGAEGFQIIGLTAGDEAFVDNDFLIHPVAACVADIRFEAGPRGKLAAFDDIGFDEHPRTVADSGDRFALLEEVAHEIDSVLIHPKRIGVRNTAWKDEAVVIIDFDVLHRFIHFERVCLLVVVVTLDLARLD